jgi:hypothetical protein
MVVRNKVYRAIDKYRSLLVSRANKKDRKSNRSKNRILDFYLKFNRWPRRNGSTQTERTLGARFENYCSKTAPRYDVSFRRLARVLGRGTNNKRKHDKRGFKKQILEFIEKHGRIPNRYKFAKIPGEGNLNAKLTYYTTKNNDMTFLGQVYSGDKCHRSGIPFKFRPLLNGLLQENRLEEPLIRTA